MNKILLFYPSFSGEGEDQPLYVDIPLSVGALAARLDGKYPLHVIDERVEPNPDLPLALREVFLVGISATTSGQITNGLRFASKVRAVNPDITIVWGGWHPSLMPEETIRHPLVDVVIAGQGELILDKLAASLTRGRSLKSIPNLYYKDKNGQTVQTAPFDVSRISMPASMQGGYRYLPMERYIHALWGSRRLLGYESSRGCPCQCAFCSISSVYRRTWTGMEAADVCADLHFLKRQYGIDAVHFFDNNFFVSKQRSLAIADGIRSYDLGIRWDGTTTVSQFLGCTEKDFDRLMQSGFYRAIIGAESGDEAVLEKIGKRHSNHQLTEAVRRCTALGIQPSLSFMVGFPWHPQEDTDNTLRLIEQLLAVNPNTEILLFLFSPYLGTPLYQSAKEHGMEFPESLEGWAGYTYGKHNTPWVTPRLYRKVKRYLGFFGTKEQSGAQKDFVAGFERKG